MICTLPIYVKHKSNLHKFATNISSQLADVYENWLYIDFTYSGEIASESGRCRTAREGKVLWLRLHLKCAASSVILEYFIVIILSAQCGERCAPGGQGGIRPSGIRMRLCQHSGIGTWDSNACTGTWCQCESGGDPIAGSLHQDINSRATQILRKYGCK